MDVLVVGSGGREHALVWKLSQSSQVDKIYCAPGNAGIAGLAECVDIEADDIQALAGFAAEKNIGLTLVGPEAPLVNGVADLFQGKGLRIFAPSKAAAEIEGSKVFSKNLMKKYGIPTARYEVFTEIEPALEHVKSRPAPMVVKADGLAAGKGVLLCKTTEDAVEAVNQVMEQKAFGDAGDRVIVEDLLVGEEASILAFSDGKTVVPMASSQDHKRALDGDKGLNTGGMGAYSPAPVVSREVLDDVMESVMVATVDALRAEGRAYKGVLYAGLMFTDEGPQVLEFNARFGDPETQVVLPRMESDLVDAINGCIDGNLAEKEIRWSSKAATCVVMASGGYPQAYEKGKAISGLDEASKIDAVVVFHAGTKSNSDSVLTNGGRVLGVTGLGSTIKDSIDKAYQAVSKISFEKAHYRTDIGFRALERSSETN